MIRCEGLDCQGNRRRMFAVRQCLGQIRRWWSKTSGGSSVMVEMNRTLPASKKREGGRYFNDLG